MGSGARDRPAAILSSRSPEPSGAVPVRDESGARHQMFETSQLCEQLIHALANMLINVERGIVKPYPGEQGWNGMVTWDDKRQQWNYSPFLLLPPILYAEYDTI
ncbi:hypothetical protein HGM15179_007179 [Zosterops borbonicus]|uniref:Uncharacterized protein n=1 Tax=Zosterops borbonicus TaxID=364589 RepID=A0A8K1LN54_9PASS|nr:hypothetical protein HGM15179_007179 [Zosterops borbonicus]